MAAALPHEAPSRLLSELVPKGARTTTVRLVSIGAGIAGLVAARNRYQRDLQRDYERLHAFEPVTLETPFGHIEYAQDGEGQPVLVVHGVFGGYDFGVGTGRANVPAGYRIISPSRFGYFGSPFPADPSPAAQGDAFAALLDHLGIDALPVVAFSAGSSSAVQLALRHPGRVSPLVLISPNDLRQLHRQPRCRELSV